MAQKVTTHYIDDLDGSDAIGTTTFGLDGHTYEIDLSEDNRAALLKTLQPFLDAARRVDGRRASTWRPGRRADTQLSRRVQLSQVRAWAREHGHTVSDYGRVPQEILQAYEAARMQAYQAGQS